MERMAKNIGIRISGTGSYAPARVLTNEELALETNVDLGWVESNLGIKRRHVVTEGELASDLACKAGFLAIESAGIHKEDVELIIVATVTPDRKAPSTACLVKHKMGIKNHSPAFDMAAACSGFLYALTTAVNFIKSGSCRRALVIGVDTFSKITDWGRRDCVFFGDGAGAVIVEASEYEDSLYSGMIFSETECTDHFTVYPNENYFSMNAKAVYQTASQVVPEAIRVLLAREGYSTDQVKCIVPHQPSVKLLKKIAENVGFPFERLKRNMDEYANTSAGTIPILLDEVNGRGELSQGDLILFAAVGSGWTWGAALYRWH